MITRKGLADEIDAIDASIKDLNASKSDAYKAYREQLEDTGVEPRRAVAELAATKAAIVKRRKLATDPDAVAEKDDLIDAILTEIQAKSSRAHEAEQNLSSSRAVDEPAIGSARGSTSAMLHPGVVDGPTTIALQAGTVVTAGETATLSPGPRISADSDGDPSIPSPEAGGAKMDGAANAVPDRAAQAGITYANSGQAVTVSDADVPEFLKKDREPVNERCEKPQTCKFGRHPQKITCSTCSTAWAISQRKSVAA